MLQSYLPLYLKYRPQTLADLVGQSSVTQTLSNAIDCKRIAHAYLFTGPRGCGKTSSARILAKSLNCDNGPTPSPCLTCTSCIEVKESRSPSVFEIDAASNNSVDDARLLIERAPLATQSGKTKIYIIDECHMLTKEAFNALLKTIEEPPPNVIFILATTEEHKVPATIVSRCQRLMFHLVGQQELSKHLRNVANQESIEIEETALDLIARRSGGGLRDALGLLDQASLMGSQGRPVTINDLLNLLGAVHEDTLLEISKGVRDRDGAAVLTAAHALLMEGREAPVLVMELAKHFLNLSKACYIGKTGSLNEEQLRGLILGSAGYIDGLIEQARDFDRAELAMMVEYLDKLEQTCRRSAQPMLNLEMGILSLCHRHDIALVQELMQKVAHLEELMAEGGTPIRPAQPKPAGLERTAAPAARPGAPSPLAAPPAASASPAQSAPAAQRPPAAAPAPSPVASAPQPTMQPTPPPHPITQPQSVVAQTATAIESSPAREAAQESEEASVEPLVSMLESADVPHLPQPGAAVPQTQTAPAPAPVPVPAQPAALPSESYGSADDRVLAEEYWSNMLEELQKRHLPTAALLANAFPLRLEENTFMIGVVHENFQKMLENKSKNDHIKGAFLAATGRDLHVKVKVVNQQAPAKPAPAVRAASRPAEPGNAEDGEEGERRGSEIRTASQPSMTDHAGPIENGAARNGAPEGAASHRTAPPPPKSDGSSLIHEAYKLFEGPGSRLIG